MNHQPHIRRRVLMILLIVIALSPAWVIYRTEREAAHLLQSLNALSS